MSPTLTRLRVFISSPGDLKIEREAAERVVRTVAKHPLYQPYYAIEAELYEDAVPAAIGVPPQEAVDEYLMLPSEADIFVCMLWQRFGTPFQLRGKSYASGTEYEFEHAYTSRQAHGKPNMLLYQCQRPFSHDCDFDQAAMVRAFFDRIRKGVGYQGLYKSFTDTKDFESKLAADLHQVVGRLLQSNHAKPARAAPPLTVSSLNDPYRLVPLDGHPLLRAEGGEQVFAGGVRVSLTLTGGSGETVSVHAVTADVVTYRPRPQENYSYALKGAALIGAGVAKAHEFALVLSQGHAGRARWITAPGQYAFSRGENLLDTPQPFSFTLAHNEVEAIVGTILVQDTGYYEIAFTFHYSQGTTFGKHTTEVIRLYAEK
ncbi:MAG TPA: DUF4062 domain-containing protein [Bryobacteraceae bacterium]|nr:DUF4062 domain-containing protein [Bryobacteraceae bacterium]